jgi:putative sigma-54 modulation protein
MKINYTWKHIDHSQAAEEYSNDKLNKVTKYVHNIVSCDVSFEKINSEIKANMNLHAGNQFFNAHNSHKDIYACVDGLEDKILSQVSKIHDKRTAHA